MTIKHVLAVKTGSYEKDGETKNRWKYIGHVHEGQHGLYITLDASVNLAAFPRKEGDDRVMVSMFEEKEKGSKPSPKKPAAQEEFVDDEIPF